jgi:uncharacterized protein (TIGR03083 family)
MDHADFVDQISIQARALRVAAVEVGPTALVDTCPGWTALHLVRHIAGTNTWALTALNTAPDGERPAWTSPPKEWDALLPWWDERVAELVDQLRVVDPDAPAWTFVGPKRAGFWARRQAHETAIHRLDAEHARLGPAVPTLLFTPEFAADGVDEFVTQMVVRAAERTPVTLAARVLFHAADAGRAWELRLVPGEVPTSGPVTDSGTDEDLVVAGTADSVYRAVWGRPSGAAVSNSALLAALPSL